MTSNQPIKIGDRVCYSRRFLQSISSYSGDMPLARGIVKEFKQIGEIVLAIVEWSEGGLPDKVNIRNLSLVRPEGGIAETY